MRFAAVAALFAGAVSAHTLYVTDVITITSCAPTVTNCPARSTVTSTTSYPVQITGTATKKIEHTVTGKTKCPKCPGCGDERRGELD
jgi:hypothetical protein